MYFNSWKHVVLVSFCVISLVLSFEFPSIRSAIFNVGSYVYDKTVCNVKECCSEKQIPGDFKLLEILLKEKVYGQHLVQDIVVNALRAHWDPTHKSQKALTLSFHGWPGGGKNYVCKFIQESLYTLGAESSYVHHFMGRIHFPQKEKAEEYKNNIYQWIKGNVTKCPKQLFIFDEVDKIPPTVLNVLNPIIDYTSVVEKVDYRKAIFIFLSNTGGSLITNHLLKQWSEGTRREDIKLKDFEKLITQGAFNEEGGFHHSDTIRSNLIDHYIPFLPMEEKHVRLCILDEFKIRGVYGPTEEHLEEVMEFVEWGPQPHNLYSKTGCKRLSQKVALVVYKHYMYHEHEEL